MSPRPLSSCAIQVAPADNVAVVREELPAGTEVQTESGEVVRLSDAVPPGHRFALRDIPQNDLVRQYGEAIGTSLGIGQGDWIRHANMSNEVPVVRVLDEDALPGPTEVLPAEGLATFDGFLRADGRSGTRNWVVVIPASMCASHEAQQIATAAEFTLWSRERYPNVDGVVALPHNKGCGTPDGDNVELVLRTLSAFATHPNVGAVLFLELGCEKTRESMLRDYLGKLDVLGADGARVSDKAAAWIGIQQAGGTRATIEQGLQQVEQLLEHANQAQRQPRPLSELVLGVECGGSDGFSGLSANPSLGFASDLVVRHGGSVILSEVPEFCGAEHLLAQRSRSAEVGREVYELVDWYKRHAARFGAELGQNPSPGNIEGGLLNITIKSLGAIAKGGTTRVEATLGYAQTLQRRGLNLMQGPGYDQESVPGMVASGANVAAFTTGRGTTIGNAIVPVIKIASNSDIYQRMVSDLDLSAGGVIDGEETIPEVGRRIFEYLQQVASAEIQSKAELNGHREFQIWATDLVSL